VREPEGQGLELARTKKGKLLGTNGVGGRGNVENSRFRRKKKKIREHFPWQGNFGAERFISGPCGLGTKRGKLTKKKNSTGRDLRCAPPKGLWHLKEIDN